MAEKTAKLRIKQKHDTEANWKKATNFRPEAGELIVYDADRTQSTPRFKVGDGTKLVNALPFVPSSDVTANPSGAGTTSLTKIEINGTVYTIPGGSSGITIPSGTSATAMLFGDNTWKEPIKINERTFKSKAGATIYAPTSKPTGTGIKYIAFDNSNNPNFFKAYELAVSETILTSSLAKNQSFNTIDLYKMSSVTFVAVKPDGGCSATTLNNSAIKGFSDTGHSIAITNDALRMYFTIDVSNTSYTTIKTGVGDYGTSGNVFKSFIMYPQY